MKQTFFSLVLFFLMCRAGAQSNGVPVHFTLDKPGYVTLVLEDARGNRVCNLLAETYLPAGPHTVVWDGYDVGEAGGKGGLVRHKVAAGTYHIRGLAHDRIQMRYEFSVNSPGSPPWFTTDGRGGWLADHSPPADALFLPAGNGSPYGGGQAQVLVCSTSGEAGSEFTWLDAQGKRLFGLNTGFWGGTHLARDNGKNALPDIVAYTFISGERDGDNNNMEVRAFRKNGSIVRVINTTFPMELKKSTLPTFKTNAEAYGTNGLAVHNGLVVFSFTRMNKLVFVDARQKRILGEASLPAPRGLVFDNQGRLIALTGTQVKRFTITPGQARLSGEQTLVATGLEDPRRLAQDAQGHLYVADWGKSHQIKVYAPDGKLLRIIGKPGGPQLGLYDEQKLSYPCGMATDDQGWLWVTEAEMFPKRLSLWTQAGKFVKGWYGGPKYGGGGALDPKDKSRFYYAEYEGGGGTEFALDWQSGTYSPKAIYWRPDRTNVEPMPGTAPERAIYAGGYETLTNSFNGQLRYNQDRGIGLWRMDKDHIAHPVAIIANAADLVNGTWGFALKNKTAIAALWKHENPAHVMFLWCDRNGDHIAQPDEVQYMVTTRRNARGEILPDMGLMPLVHPDLSITTSWGTRIMPPRLDERGTPIYDLTKQQIVGNPDWQRSPLVAGNATVSSQDGVAALLGANLKGGAQWRYNYTPEAHIGGAGLMVAPTRQLGFPVHPSGGQAGDIIAISGEKGVIYLLTMDGLFVQTLGGDMRDTPLWRMSGHPRGMTIDNVSFEDEHFHPTINQTSDGSIYLVAGKEHSSILKLEGLETVQREDFGTITVTAQTLAGLPPTLIEEEPKGGRPTLTVARTDQDISITGDTSNLPADTMWAKIDARASGAVLIARDRLVAAFQTGDANALANAGSDPVNLFKFGGALDLMIGANPHVEPNRQQPVAGDMRLLVTRVKSKTKAMLYRAVAPNAAPESRVLFASPVGKVTFDLVEDVSDKVELAQQGGNYEFAIPLSVLGWNPQSGQEFSGDLGLLRGNGAQTTQRAYWSNRNALIVSDIPSEARLQPSQWGVWRIR